ncbi:unnamed product [Ostreococcus tauri]|uniref:Unnamed product n=1 Tax=Ostreococcus tauri TaxID=70448 RepID=A0A096P7B2_OSTTA|nr:unnamed product [Ostreococcus tauri]CEF97041.1 unnamed product [Ostreococcus tauri]|eukprot:XP_022838451.1 unnamed product [Ostreococcus tauri]
MVSARSRRALSRRLGVWMHFWSRASTQPSHLLVAARVATRVDLPHRTRWVHCGYFIDRETRSRWRQRARVER